MIFIFGKKDYTTTRENWELRRDLEVPPDETNYTTTRENWELRPFTAVIEGKLELYHYERKLGTTT